MNLDMKTKIQLCILPILMAFLVWYNYDKFFKTEQIDTSIKVEVNKEKKFDEEYLKLCLQIEKFAKSKKIEIIKIAKDDDFIRLLVESSLTKSKNFVEFVEGVSSFTKIDKITFEEVGKSKKYFYNIDISLKKHYKKKAKIKKEKKAKDTKFKLSAIIGSYAIVNGKILKKDDEIKGYVLEKLGKNYIELKNKDKTIKVELFDDETTKNIH